MRSLPPPIGSGPRAIVLAVLCTLGTAVPSASETLEFDGRIEAAEEAVVYSRAEGVVAEVLVFQGDFVEIGDVLVRLERDIAQLAVDAARAELARAEALLDQARGRLGRVERLSQTGAGSEVSLIQAQTGLALAEADLAAQQAVLNLAETALEDTVIRAPISGYVENPQVRLGALLEFDAAAPPLFRIVKLDPVRLSYAVPYADRLDQLSAMGTNDATTLLENVRLRIAVSDGEVLRSDVVPNATSVNVDPDTDTLRVWATVENADGVLRPGMRVNVLSDVGGIGGEATE